jgi:hypothetical protein
LSFSISSSACCALNAATSLSANACCSLKAKASRSATTYCSRAKACCSLSLVASNSPYIDAAVPDKRRNFYLSLKIDACLPHFPIRCCVFGGAVWCGMM